MNSTPNFSFKAAAVARDANQESPTTTRRSLSAAGKFISPNRHPIAATILNVVAIPYKSDQYPAPRLEVCPFCSSGTFSPGGNVITAVCSDCAAGFYCVTPASKEPCPLGTYCPAKSTLPISLAKGSYAINAAGTYVQVGGQGQMVCEAGYACDGGTRTLCGENELPNGARSTCIPCLTCRVGYGFISACLAGKNTVCEPCGPNAISAGGTQTCVECLENTRPNDSKTACIPCLTCRVGEGHMSACINEVDTICEPCGPNAISAGGTQKCMECKENTRPNDSKTACVPCVRCAIGHGVEFLCAVGGQDTQCESCVGGEFHLYSYKLCVLSQQTL